MKTKFSILCLLLGGTAALAAASNQAAKAASPGSFSDVLYGAAYDVFVDLREKFGIVQNLNKASDRCRQVNKAGSSLCEC